MNGNILCEGENATNWAVYWNKKMSKDKVKWNGIKKLYSHTHTHASVYTECARDCVLYKLVSCSKFVNEILFCIIYEIVYLTLRHHVLAVILSSCLNFFLSYQQLNCFDTAKEAYKIKGSIFLSVKVTISGTPGRNPFNPLCYLGQMICLRMSRTRVITAACNLWWQANTVWFIDLDRTFAEKIKKLVFFESIFTTFKSYEYP
jgi:hypothetical protein